MSEPQLFQRVEFFDGDWSETKSHVDNTTDRSGWAVGKLPNNRFVP